MRILYLTQYFPPEVNAPAQRVVDFARAWQEAGHDVTVLTGFPNHPNGIIYDGYKLKKVQHDNVDGIKTIRTYLYPAANKGVVRRSINYISFAASAAIFGKREVEDVDIVIASCPQLLVGLAGYEISKAKKVPFVLEVRDVWPEALQAVDAKLPKPFFNLLRRIAKFLYKRAVKIITVTYGAKEIICKYGVPDEKLEMIPSGIRTDIIRPLEPSQDLRNKLLNGQSIMVSYIGTHGMAQKLSTVLDAAHKLLDDSRIRFVLVGDGAEKSKLINTKEELGLTNVTFLDQMTREEALQVTAASDICLAPLRKADLFKITVPSKVYELMACGRPIILGVDGEARELLEKANAGIFVEPENSEALAEAVLRLADDPELRRSYGLNGRRYIEEHYDKAKLSMQYLDLLKKLANK